MRLNRSAATRDEEKRLTWDKCLCYPLAPLEEPMSKYRPYTALCAAARPMDRSCDRLFARVGERLRAGIGVMGSLNTPDLGQGKPD